MAKNKTNMMEWKIKSRNENEAELLGTALENYIDELRDTEVDRAEESVVNRTAPALIRVVFPEVVKPQLMKLIGKNPVEVEESIHHRSPFGFVCDDLTKNGWSFRGKLKGDRGDEYRIYVKGGRTRILHHPTFKLHQLILVSTDHLNTHKEQARELPKRKVNRRT